MASHSHFSFAQLWGSMHAHCTDTHTHTSAELMSVSLCHSFIIAGVMLYHTEQRFLTFSCIPVDIGSKDRLLERYRFEHARFVV